MFVARKWDDREDLETGRFVLIFDVVLLHSFLYCKKVEIVELRFRAGLNKSSLTARKRVDQNNTYVPDI